MAPRPSDSLAGSGAMDEGRIKGAAFREALLWMRGELGPERLRDAFAAVPAQHATLFDARSETFGVLASAWYPAAAVHPMLDALLSGTSRDAQRQLAYDASRAALSVTLRGVHRAIMRVVGSPELHRRFAQRLWNTHFDGGVAVVEDHGDGAARVVYTHWPAHHRFLCWMCTASDLVIYEAMGCREVSVDQDGCVDTGDGACAHFVRWRA